MTTNAIAVPCERCGNRVEAGDGFVKGGMGSDGSWSVVHNSCIPVADGYLAGIAHKIILRRVRLLVEELATLTPTVRAAVALEPEAARLRTLLAKLEYDL